MRKSIPLIIIVLLALSTSVFAQTKKVSVNVKDLSFPEFFEEIRKQTDYSFFFNDKKIAELDRITISKSDITVKELLTNVLRPTTMTYKMVDGVIVIVDREPVNQTVSVNGTVIEKESGDPLPGVNIRIKGSVLGTVTDLDGNFHINLPGTLASGSTHPILVFSFMGYAAQEVEIDGQERVYVALESESMDIDEFVVTGYQIIDKTELTSSIASVTAEDLDIVSAITVDRMLEGKAPGLMVNNISSTPGAAAKVRVRGGSTFTGNQSPLWVVDGIIYSDPVPLSASDINSFDNVNIIGNALTGINPSDIAKIDILKDASATAIYGTQAANGVIVITTKRGEKGAPSLNYSGGYSFTQAPQYSNFNLMNSLERIDVSREMYERNLGYSGSYENVDRLGYEGALINLWDGTYTYQEFQDRVGYLETLNSDWFGELFRNSFSQKHSVSASGGSESARYYFSLGYDNQQGAEQNVGLKRITARSNLDLDLRDNVVLSFRMNGSVQEGSYNHSSINSFNTAYYTSRTVPIYDENGEYFYQSQVILGSNDDQIYGRYNVLNEIANSEQNITNKDFSIVASLRWEFLENFRFTSQASFRNTTNLTEEWITEDAFYTAKLRSYDAFEDLVQRQVDNNSMVPFGGVYNGGMVNQDYYSITNQLNYNKSINNRHVINVNLGQEARSTKYWGATGFTVPGYNHFQGRGFVALPAPSFTVDDNSNTVLNFADYNYDAMINWLTTRGNLNVYPKITDRTINNLSVFGIFNYIYDNRYIFNFNLRSDGSNTFGQYERYKFKPTWSVSTRWNIHNEAFWNRNNIFDELAFRASYGVRGTMPGSSPYLIITNYGKNNATYYPENTSFLSEFPNANLRWEKTQTTDFGLNYSLLGGRISGAFDYSYSRSTDLLQGRPVSLVNGTAVQMYNSGSKDVSSYEFMVQTINVKRGKFAWSTHLNFSYDRDRVLQGFEDGAERNLTIYNYLQGNIYREGFPTNGFFSYQFDGLSEEGLPTFKHLDEGDMTAEEQLQAALTYEGSRVPLYYGGFGTQFRMGNFRLAANFTYKLGYKTRLLNLFNGNQNLPLPYENMHSDFNDRWRNPGDELTTDIPALTNHNMAFSSSTAADGYSRIYVSNYGTVVPEGTNAWWMYDYSDARVVKADHIRFQTLTLSYNVPNHVINKAGISNLTLGLQGNNIAVWSFDKRLNGQDPEQVSGIGLPSVPSYSFSINMGF